MSGSSISRRQMCQFSAPLLPSMTSSTLQPRKRYSAIPKHCMQPFPLPLYLSFFVFLALPFFLFDDETSYCYPFETCLARCNDFAYLKLCVPCHYQAPEFDRWSNTSANRGPAEALRLSHSGRGSHELPFPSGEDNPLSPGYTEPLCVSLTSYLTAAATAATITTEGARECADAPKTKKGSGS